MSLSEKYSSGRTPDKRRVPSTTELSIYPSLNFEEVYTTVAALVFTQQPWDVFIKKGKVTAHITATSIMQANFMEHVDRKKAIDAVSYACLYADIVILVEPSTASEKVPITNTPFKEFIEQNRRIFSYLDEISGKK